MGCVVLWSVFQNVPEAACNSATDSSSLLLAQTTGWDLAADAGCACVMVLFQSLLMTNIGNISNIGSSKGMCTSLHILC